MFLTKKEKNRTHIPGRKKWSNPLKINNNNNQIPYKWKCETVLVEITHINGTNSRSNSMGENKHAKFHIEKKMKYTYEKNPGFNEEERERERELRW